MIATGEMVYPEVEAGRLLALRGIIAMVIDMHTIRPLDTDTIIKAAKETGRIVTIEEHSVFGGFDSAVAESVVQHLPVK